MTTRILKNQTDQIVVIDDIGEIKVPASGQFDLTNADDVIFSLQMINGSDDLKQAVTDDKLLINNGYRDLSKKESLEILNFSSELEAYNPDNYIYMTQANLLQNIFQNHTEEIYLESSLKNVFADTYKGSTKTSSYNNVVFDGASISLLGTVGSSLVFDDFEDISDWSTQANISLALESSIVHEGTHSGKITVQSNVQSAVWKYIWRDILTPFLDWSAYDTIRLWVYGVGVGEKIRIYISDDNTGTSFTTTDFELVAGWQEVELDISLANRSTIESVRIEIQKNVSDEVIIYVDDFKVVTVGSYETSGYAIGNTTTITANITHIYYSDLVDLPESTSYTIKISLDGGNNWHLLDFDAGDKNSWLDVTQWNEYGDFTNLKNVKVRIDLSTSDTDVTPQVDDYFVMWKLDV